MSVQSIFVDRRRRSRNGSLGRVEDITYSVLRKYGIAGSKREKWDSRSTAASIARPTRTADQTNRVPDFHIAA